jgi:erythromycin esterase-like protein
VTAASDWDAPARRRHVRPSLPGSVERLLHDAGIDCGVLDLRGGALRVARLQPMIGVIYRPESERQSHYLTAEPSEQFDVLVHVDETSALQPLDRLSQLDRDPDTVPFGI